MKVGLRALTSFYGHLIRCKKKKKDHKSFFIQVLHILIKKFQSYQALYVLVCLWIIHQNFEVTSMKTFLRL